MVQLPNSTNNYHAAYFNRDVAHHEMQVLLDDGLYRHLQFRNRKSGLYWFDLVTWPGKLAVTGDWAGFIFSSTEDMFGFFRDSATTRDSGERGVNPGYWQDKVRAGRSDVREYSEDLFRALALEDVKACWPRPEGLLLKIQNRLFNDWDIDTEEGARAALARFDFRGFRFRHVTDWELQDYSWQFLWCCHAVLWGIGRYDAAKAATPEAVA